MTRISHQLVEYYPATGDIEPVAGSYSPNPIPARGLEERGELTRLRRAETARFAAMDDATRAAMVSGIGRIDWDKVRAVSPKAITAFKKKYEIFNLLATNAKTEKPRPSTARKGFIKGMNLAPHFYPNLLNVTDTKPSGALEYVNRVTFNSFNGTSTKTVLPDVNAPGFPEIGREELLDFCAGSSSFCRATCLVTTGQHPATMQAAHSKMKSTFAFLSDPVTFTAVLHKQLAAFARSAKKDGYDAVVRLNMLSDVPWYILCPELLEAHGPDGDSGRIWMYDYTKVRYWDNPEYDRVRDLLDLTFSFSGSNERDCADALAAGERIAVVFAPADPKRSATAKTRTSWREIQNSGLLDSQGRASLFGGKWLVVDGDESDFRIDDPKQCIVALNFKQPMIKSETAPHLKEAIPKARGIFALKVADETGRGGLYTKARAKQIWSKIFPKSSDYDVSDLTVDQVFDVIGTYDSVRAHSGKEKGLEAAQERAYQLLGISPTKAAANGRLVQLRRYESNPYEENPEDQMSLDEELEIKQSIRDPSEVLDRKTSIPMFKLEGVPLLIGPHVPTIEQD